ncbi:uncharacterized protein LOC119390603 [Rhipicephalus sanguineus]|uniref:Monocarboxylate transporter n=1 Tax=Rhipicephalus sanguineus TaxID=34632 RepID=A0A9D4PTQ6_RHISA|nr:uncharacterized protein LOC119390603 [Rhipicephalus sanguineus]KAH7955675.1 hypothetical protein HPB52_002847 [Rhipicephalus sanguineus]
MAAPVISNAVVPSECTAVRQGANASRATRPAGGVDTRWRVAVAAMFIAFFTVASSSNLGFFYVYFHEEFQTTRQQASWPGSVLQIMGHVSGILVAILQPIIPIFYIAFFGSILLWLGLLAAVFAPTIPWMTVTFGFLHGGAIGIVSVSVIVALMTHFEKYRGVACGLKYTGNTLAALLLPKLLSWLQELYSFKGTLLIYAALTMNATAFTLFFRNNELTRVRKPRQQTDRNTSPEGTKSDVPAEGLPVGDNDTSFVQSGKSVGACDSRIYGTRTATSEIKCADFSRDHSQEKLQKPEHITQEVTTELAHGWETSIQEGDMQKTRHLSKKHDFPVSKTELAVTTDGGLVGPTSDVLQKEKGSGKWIKGPNLDEDIQCNRSDLQRKLVSEQSYGSINDASGANMTGHLQFEDESSAPRTCHSGTLELLSKPTFYLLVLGAVASDYTALVVQGTIVDYALDKGVERKSAELSMTYCAPTEFVGRLILPLVADFKFIGRTTLAASCFGAMTITSLALPYTVSFTGYIVVEMTTIFFLACVATLKAVLVADNFGAKAVPTFWGANGLALIPLLSANPFITGYFRDKLGSYDNLLRLLAGIQLFTAIVFFALAYVQKRTSKVNS